MERVAFTVRLPAELHRRLKVWSAQQGTDLQDGTTRAVESFLGLGGHASNHLASCPLARASLDEQKQAALFLQFWRASPPDTRNFLIFALAAYLNKRA